MVTYLGNNPPLLFFSRSTHMVSGGITWGCSDIKGWLRGMKEVEEKGTDGAGDKWCRFVKRCPSADDMGDDCPFPITATVAGRFFSSTFLESH